MDALKKALALLAVLIVVIVPVCLTDSADADAPDGLLIQQVNPKECEGVAVHNYGSTAVDMKDYTIADKPQTTGSKEGTLIFTESIIVQPGETLVLASERKDGNFFSNQDNVRIYSGEDADPAIVKSKNFSLANGGDDVYLFKNGEIVDAVMYGFVIEIEKKPGWNGPSVNLKYDLPLERYNGKDTNSAADWAIVGTTHYEFNPNLKYDATVTPFLFPESGGIPILQQLQAAERSICIEMYQLMNANVYALLCEKASSGVIVSLLLSGDSVANGYDPIVDNLPYLKKLSDLGADIRIISGTSYDRFDFVHAKYAVIDGDTTIVTSENWTQKNVNGAIDTNPYDSKTLGNRGWGTVVKSTAYASFMMNVFENDSDMRYGDVQDFKVLYPKAVPTDVAYIAPADIDYTFQAYTATVTPVLSCDNSMDALEYYVNNAKTRAYSQQQSLSEYYNTTTLGPLSFFEKAALRSVDSKLIFDSSVGKGTVGTINATSSIEVAAMTSPYVHNKGVVCDDSVWVSSVNWTPTSFNNNRETCVVINSKTVSDYFADVFLKDFERYYTFEGFSAYFSETPDKPEAGKEQTVTVTVSPATDTYTYEWDLGDGSAIRKTTIGRIVFSPTEGIHTMKVTVTNSTGLKKTVEWTYNVGSSSSGTDPVPPTPTDPDKPVPDTPSEPSTPEEDSPLTDIEETLGDKLYIILAVLILIVSGIAAKVKGSSKNKKKGKKR